MKPWSLLLIVFICITETVGTFTTIKTWSGQLNYTEDWGYAKIRPSANTFWWLYSVKSAENRPLILWLQGGPGSASTGYGNFEEIGPKDYNEKERMSTWLQLADLVFVDNPVGTGFSYVEDSTAFTTNITQIGEDLFKWAVDFFERHSEYKTRPFYIFTESYGGKMGAEFARVLHKNKDALKINFVGVALGDSWISAMDYVNTWAPYLYNNGFLDDEQLQKATSQAKRCQKLMDQGKLTDATYCWGDMESLIGSLTGGISWYNILKSNGQDDWSKKRRRRSTLRNRVEYGAVMARAFHNHVGFQQHQSLADYMDTIVRQKVGIIPSGIKFGGQANEVFNHQYGDFMTPNYATVDELLKNGVNVIVFNGNLDLICNTLGTENWMKRLQWSGISSFNKAPKTAFSTKSFSLAGYSKTYKNFQFYSVLRAGHMVAHDAEEAAVWMVKKILKL